MYQALLTRRYLTSKVMPLLAAVAVTLCVAMVLIVWSVMGGFLTMLVDSGRTLIGDVSISHPSTGFAYYDDLVLRLEKDELVEAATPTIETFGLLALPLGTGAPETVVIKGVDGPGFDRVTGFSGTLWWRPLDKPLAKDKKREDPRLDPKIRDLFAELLRQGERLTSPVAGRGGEESGAIVLGTQIGGYNERRPEGWLEPLYFLPGQAGTLSVMPMDMRGRTQPDQKSIRLPIANQFHSGLYEVDANTVLVRVDVLQRLLNMNEATRPADDGGSSHIVRRINPETGREEFVEPGNLVKEPARVTNVLVRGKPGIEADRLKARVEEVYAAFAADHAGDVLPPPERIRIRTWRDQNRTLISAVEKETALVLFIFGIIALTSVFLVLAIFWAMVSEKTKDIGILRAIGAGRGGVAWIWLRYGLVIGVVGALAGGGIAYLIVTNINPIHEWLGRQLGLVIWDPQVYYFSVIPNKMDPTKAALVMVFGVAASVAGALVPALKAAYMDPVRALRFE